MDSIKCNHSNNEMITPPSTKYTTGVTFFKVFLISTI